MLVAMPVIVAVVMLVAMVMAVTVVMVGAAPMRRIVSVIGMRVGFVVVVMVAMVVVAMVLVAALAVVVGSLLRLEGPVHRAGRAARAADQFGGAGRDVENVRADLGGNVLAAELPGEAQQTGGIAGADFEQRLLGGAHADETPVVELQRVAVLKARGALEGQIDGQPARRGQMGMRLSPRGVVEGHRIDDEIGPDGGLADDQAGFGHGGPRS
jgi:hypothetical protein